MTCLHNNITGPGQVTKGIKLASRTPHRIYQIRRKNFFFHGSSDKCEICVRSQWKTFFCQFPLRENYRCVGNSCLKALWTVLVTCLESLLISIKTGMLYIFYIFGVVGSGNKFVVGTLKLTLVRIVESFDIPVRSLLVSVLVNCWQIWWSY